MADNIPSDAMKQNIPGVSWTLPPKSLPWQRPPKHAAVSDVLQAYIEKLSDPDILKNMVSMLKETKMPLSIAAESIMLVGVHKGTHTIDAGFLVMPVLMELIKTAAMLEGVDVPTYPNDMVKKEKPVDPLIIDKALEHAFASMKTATNEESSMPAESSGLMSKKKGVM
jgi:hypothetical protein